MATINTIEARKNTNPKKKREPSVSIRRRLNDAFRNRKKPVGRTLSTESVVEILTLAQEQGCTALFDLGAGAGLILEQAKALGFAAVGGIEIDAEISGKNNNIFTTSFAEFNTDNADTWASISGGRKTLFYIYEGGLWDPQWCLDAVKVVKKLAKLGDYICIITHTGTTSFKKTWNIVQWKRNLSGLLGRETKIPVSGDPGADRQRENQMAHIYRVRRRNPKVVYALRL